MKQNEFEISKIKNSNNYNKIKQILVLSTQF